MFFFSLTRSSIHEDLEIPLISEINSLSYVVTVASPDPTVTCDPSSDGFTVKGYTLLSAPPALKEPLLEIECSHRRGAVVVRKSSLCGLPLYYHINDDGEFFCSTHIALLRKAGVDILEDSEVLAEFFVYRCVMPPSTLYKGIKRIQHGGTIEVSLREDGWQLGRRGAAPWLVGKTTHVEASFTDHVSTLVSCLTDSIRGIEDGSNAPDILLSGGIDSSIVAELSRKHLKSARSVSTSYPFELPSLEMERPYALSAAEALNFSHTHYQSTNAEYRSGLIEAIALAEEPVHHLQSVCLHLLFKNAIEPGQQTVVQGLGAGVSFGNFRNHLYMKDKLLFKLLSLRPCLSTLELVSRATERGEITVSELRLLRNKATLDDPENPIWGWHRHGNLDWACSRFHTSPDQLLRRQLETIQATDADSVYDLWARYALLGDEDVTLALWSKIAHGNGCFLYSPLYDPRVLQSALSIPWSGKLRPPSNRLRKSIARRLGVPDFVITRPKTGFGIKRADWALEDGPFDPLVSLAEKVFDPGEIRQMRTTTSSEAMTFWNMITYAIWKRLMINGERVEDLVNELAEAEGRRSHGS